MEPGYTYYAFISYSRKDSAFAARLQRFLERYRLPSALCRKYPHVPKDVRPVRITDVDKMGQSCAAKNGVARMTAVYDPVGNVISSTSYGVEGREVNP